MPHEARERRLGLILVEVGVDEVLVALVGLMRQLHE